jgi:hypothetical protein
MDKRKKALNQFLNDLETNVACEIEINNLDFNAHDELVYKKNINLN